MLSGRAAAANTDDLMRAGGHPLSPALAPNNDGDYHSGRLWSLAGFGIVPAVGMQVFAFLGFCMSFFQIAQLTTEEDEIDRIDPELAAAGIVNPLAFLFWFFQPEYTGVWAKLVFGRESLGGGERDAADPGRRALLANLCFIAIPNIFIASSWVDASPYVYTDGIMAMDAAHIAILASTIYAGLTILILMCVVLS